MIETTIRCRSSSLERHPLRPCCVGTKDSAWLSSVRALHEAWGRQSSFPLTTARRAMQRSTGQKLEASDAPSLVLRAGCDVLPATTRPRCQIRLARPGSERPSEAPPGPAPHPAGRRTALDDCTPRPSLPVQRSHAMFRARHSSRSYAGSTSIPSSAIVATKSTRVRRSSGVTARRPSFWRRLSSF